ncbi:penicillin acylase family protein [Actinopolymorpha alba]|uniref:penicillin acylase family protein n=1 Tax=Actinopolymorpha alba TaxID=533267 RepID=UPI00035E2D03|nr:penicillin acylase family protein [Actinopolymorpha alba]
MQRPLLTRLGTVLAILLGLTLIATTAGLIMGVRRSFPEYDGREVLAGLGSQALVRRDASGVPQISAGSPEDLFRAQGYVHAQDRFYEMDFGRHLTSGRLAEWFGPSMVETDAFVRTLGWRRVASQEYPRLSAQTRSYLQAYADGVNAYLATHSGSRLSVEYTMGLLGPDDRPEPWTPVDSLAWLKAMAWNLRGNMDDEIARALTSTKVPATRVADLYPAYPFDRHPPIVTRLATAGADAGRQNRRAVFPEGTTQALRQVQRLLDTIPSPRGLGEGDGIGSNSWVVAGSRTTTGKPMLANDPHLSPQMPSIWYQQGLHCKDPSTDCQYDVAGFGFAGVPGIVIGHNTRIAWGFTNLGPDVMDLYVERLDGDTYMYDGSRLPLSSRREIIQVKDQPSVEIVVRSTRHGPLLSDVDPQLRAAVTGAATGREARAGGWKAGVSLRWTALDAGTTAEAIFDLNTARNWSEFRAAAARFEVPAQNLVYADVDGHIGYQAPGRIPIRRGSTGEWPVPGWSSRFEWTGWVPFDQLPSAFDPSEGYIVTANQAVAPPSYPYRLADHWSYGYRSDRITDLIRAQGKLDVAAMERIQLDTYNANAAFLVPHLRRIKVDAFTAEGQALLDGWDFTQGVDSAPAAYFNAVWKNLLAATFHDQIPKDAWPSGGDRWYEVVRDLMKDPRNLWWDDVRTKGVREDRDTILRQAMVEARKELTRLLAKDPKRWRWGKLHKLELVNQSFGQSDIGPLERLFNRGPYELPGGTDAVLATSWNAASGGYDVTAVPSMRMVVDLADFDRSRWVNVAGVSGHPGSDHYNDQTEAWSRGRTMRWPFRPAAVERATENTLTLVP